MKISLWFYTWFETSSSFTCLFCRLLALFWTELFPWSVMKLLLVICLIEVHQIDLTEILIAYSFSLSVTQYVSLNLDFFFNCREKEGLNMGDTSQALLLKMHLPLSGELPNTLCWESSILPLVIAHKAIIFVLAWQAGKRKPFDKWGGLKFYRNSKALCTESSLPRVWRHSVKCHTDLLAY